MFGWIWRGLRTGVVTTRYPRGSVETVSRTVPRIDTGRLSIEDCAILDVACPTGALTCEVGGVPPYRAALILDYGRCISCAYCADALPDAVSMTTDFELAARDRADDRIVYTFRGENSGSD